MSMLGPSSGVNSGILLNDYDSYEARSKDSVDDRSHCDGSNNPNLTTAEINAFCSEAYYPMEGITGIHIQPELSSVSSSDDEDFFPKMELSTDIHGADVHGGFALTTAVSVPDTESTIANAESNITSNNGARQLLTKSSSPPRLLHQVLSKPSIPAISSDENETSFNRLLQQCSVLLNARLLSSRKSYIDHLLQVNRLNLTHPDQAKLSVEAKLKEQERTIANNLHGLSNDALGSSNSKKRINLPKPKKDVEEKRLKPPDTKHNLAYKPKPRIKSVESEFTTLPSPRTPPINSVQERQQIITCAANLVITVQKGTTIAKLLAETAREE